MIETGFLSTIYQIGKDAWAYFRGKKRRLSASEILTLRKKWKSEFEDQIIIRRRDKLRSDVIIHDVKRVDHYPEIDGKGKGISPWFRVGLIATYHRGIQIGLRWGGLTKDQKSGEWRFTNHKVGEQSEITVLLVGYIPFENIESVDWVGDEYYGFPHIYCHFDTNRKEPYESLAFCEKRWLDELPFYPKIAEYDSTAKLSKRRGVEFFT